MAATLKLVSIGNATGVILPQETLDRLLLQRGDTLYMRETPAGLELSPYHEDFGAKIEIPGSVVRRYRDAFKNLAE
jgi:putative addiction module antidote